MSGANFQFTFVPHCTACGAELRVGVSITDEQKNLSGGSERHYFVGACENCFTFKGDSDEDLRTSEDRS